MSDFEITVLVLSEHENFRRKFAALNDADDAEELAAAWEELAAALEVHAVAEEQLVYPLLAHGVAEGAAESEEAVREHNDIRHAIQAVTGHEVGSEDWWQAVRATQDVNATHMADEEREFLPDFKQAVSDERREELGMSWLQFHEEHDKARGLSGEDTDPQDVLDASAQVEAP
ncbi:hemerythrin domain-containing protein [Jatrophihabitans lederbergiae]|uniref:Hemerythrin domain-containing protein n=1 Tax=Jatrophihabitans lederbergiae TaxID=3075547 RepID=A0ABU2JDV5_9ACTN|nr:hemerythrin domain-containing protein [Jatrophihabitans sp. DSM 44399]MDT0262903.1 hemerythrin domain-containing protein [Jatrophihabitans sp. DSM 44399]